MMKAETLRHGIDLCQCKMLEYSTHDIDMERSPVVLTAVVVYRAWAEEAAVRLASTFRVSRQPSRPA